MNEQDLTKLGYVKQPDGSYKRESVLVARVSAAVPEQAAVPKQVRSDEVKAGSARRARVRLVTFRCRLLDPDNAVGGVKALVDSLRYRGYITNDDPASIQLEVYQVKVAHRNEQGTLVEIVPL
jgi:hypothetical protein